MTSADRKEEGRPKSVLTPEQEALLDSYIKNLDNVWENLQESENIQVEIETLHLKRLLAS